MDLIRRLVKERAVNPQLSRGLGTGGKAVKRGGWRLGDPGPEPGIQAGHDSGSGAGLTEGVGPGAGGTREALRPCPQGSGQFTCHLLCLPERLGSALRRPPRVDSGPPASTSASSPAPCPRCPDSSRPGRAADCILCASTWMSYQRLKVTKWRPEVSPSPPACSSPRASCPRERDHHVPVHPA